MLHQGLVFFFYCSGGRFIGIYPRHVHPKASEEEQFPQARLEKCVDFSFNQSHHNEVKSEFNGLAQKIPDMAHKTQANPQTSFASRFPKDCLLFYTNRFSLKINKRPICPPASDLLVWRNAPKKWRSKLGPALPRLMLHLQKGISCSHSGVLTWASVALTTLVVTILVT